MVLCVVISFLLILTATLSALQIHDAAHRNPQPCERTVDITKPGLPDCDTNGDKRYSAAEICDCWNYRIPPIAGLHPANWDDLRGYLTTIFMECDTNADQLMNVSEVLSCYTAAEKRNIHHYNLHLESHFDMQGENLHQRIFETS
jgi:hypothetical protein